MRDDGWIYSALLDLFVNFARPPVLNFSLSHGLIIQWNLDYEGPTTSSPSFA